ncbi:hypothetical protein OR1_00149 [Geobacter sp. OR-1]|nr:hypothetical protein OR1_00149 [Geobacter sp. OR-1]
MGKQSNQIPLGAAADEQGRLLTEHLGSQPFQPVDRRVLAEDVVTNLCPGHGRAHGRSRPGYGIATEIYRFHVPLTSRDEINNDGEAMEP